MTAACLALAADGRSVAVPLRVVRGPLAIVTQCMTRLQTYRGDWIDDQGYGLRHAYYASHPALPRVEIEGDIRSQLREIDGVVEVVSVTAPVVGTVRQVGAVVRVRSDEGTAVYAVGAAVPDTEGGWYAAIFSGGY